MSNADAIREFYASPTPTAASSPAGLDEVEDPIKKFYTEPTAKWAANPTAPAEEPPRGKTTNAQAVADFYASELRPPEGFEPNAEHLASFRQLASDHFISAKAQQALLDYAGKVLAAPVDAFKTLDEQIAADDARARAAAARIPEEDVRRAREVVREANDPQLNQFLEVSGLGNSAPMIRLLARLARR